MLSSKTQPGKRHDPPTRPARPTTPYCPMRGARCLSECAWNTPGGHVEPVDAPPDGVLERPSRR